MLRKILVRVGGVLAYVWYKFIYGGSFVCAGIPKIRRRLSLVIGKGAIVSLGKGVFLNNDCSINCRQEVHIGNDRLFGEGVKIYDHNHRFRDPNRPIASQGFKCAPVFIGNNTWIGSDVVILKGVTIGSNVVIGAGCIVDFDIPPKTIVRRSGEQTSMSWGQRNRNSEGEEVEQKPLD